VTPESALPEVLDHTELSEATLTRMIREVEVPLLDALKEEYPNRVNIGWQVCGAACLALQEVLEELEGIPSSKFRIIVRMYDPPSRPDKRTDQTSLLITLSNAKDRVLFVDPTYKLGYQGRQEKEGATIIRSFARGEIDSALQTEYHLAPFRFPLIGELGKIGFLDAGNFTMSSFMDLVTALNDGSAFQNQSVGNATGNIIQDSIYWGDAVNRVIRQTVLTCKSKK